MFFQSKRKEMSDTPELDYYLNEELSDFVFIVEGKPIPVLKSCLSMKSRVFRAMFSGNFKESKDKELVIEDTKYEAFKTFIRFLYSNDLVLNNNDFDLIRELYRLSDKYDVSQFERKITDELILTNSHLFNSKKFRSEEDLTRNWPKLTTIAKLASDWKITKLMDNVMTFLSKNFDHILKKDNKELRELCDLTDGKFIDLLANNCRIGKNQSNN